jgi:hypothetical protein
MLLPETVDPDPARRGARIDPRIERFVPLAHLLPLGTAITLHDPRDELLGGELLKVLIAVSREVAIPGRMTDAAIHVLVSRSVLA